MLQIGAPAADAVPVQLAQRLEDRDSRNRRNRELVIWWLRLAAVVFTTFQTALSPGDAPWLSWVVAGCFWASTAVLGVLLRRDMTDRGLRLVGAASMAADAAVLVTILGNNLTDPAEPIYLVSILAVLEATMRWPRLGGAIGGVAAGIGAGAWTVAVYVRIDQPIEVSFATMRMGVFVVIGVSLGALTRRLSDQHQALERILDSSRDLVVTID